MIHKLHILVYLSILFLSLLITLLLSLHLTSHPSLVLPLMRFLSCSFSLLIVILSLTNCNSNYFPISLVKQCSPILLSTITSVINIRLSQLASFLISLNVLYILTWKNVTCMDKDDLSNIIIVLFHFLFLSKFTERIVTVTFRLVNYLSTSNLLNSFQSAYQT